MDPNRTNPPADDEVEQLRRAIFPHLAREYVEIVKLFCDRRGFNPWANHVAAEVRPGRNGTGQPELAIMVRIDGMRARAIASGRSAGDGGEELKVAADGTIESATFYVYRSIGRRKRKFHGTARWASYYPGRGASPFWDKMGPEMIVKCAEAIALRRAYPDELGGCYAPEEMDQAFARGRGGGGDWAAPSTGTGAGAGEDLPASPEELNARLAEYGFEDEGARDRLVEGFRSRWRAEGDTSRTFYMNVFKAVRENPEQYGGRVPAAVA